MAVSALIHPTTTLPPRPPQARPESATPTPEAERPRPPKSAGSGGKSVDIAV